MRRLFRFRDSQAGGGPNPEARDYLRPVPGELRTASTR